MQCARCDMWETLTHLATLLILLPRSRTPHDGEYFRPRVPQIERFALELIGRFLDPKSRLHGFRHLAEALERSKRGERVLLLSNHSSELDPLLLSVLLDRTERSGDPWAETASDVRRALAVVVGHKVLLSRFRRFFSSACDVVPTIAAKYRTDHLEPDALAFADTYVRNSHAVMRLLLEQRERLLLVFPEGGRTRENEIIFQSNLLALARGATLVPLGIEAPPGFLQIESEEMIAQPLSVRIACGKPFRLERAQGKDRMHRLLAEHVASVGDAGFPTENYRWGYRNSKGISYLP